MSLVYGYLKSIVSFTSQLVAKYDLPMEGHPGLNPTAQGLTDPKVKNEWQILPRTSPTKLSTLSATERAATRRLLQDSPAIGDAGIWKSALDYILGGGEVAGHGINDATIGGSPAALFEFRQIPPALLDIVPKAAEVRVELAADLLAQFGAARADAVRALNSLVNDNKASFQSWAETTYDKWQGKDASKLATANQKAAWVAANRPADWSRLTAGPPARP